ncbi:hypothetical protein ED733_005793 [Metarhizium rileyi]|uniref:Uncharacterized protein n=1 Tax=Metarhizium rileyi (strain RCEF 4871) TaxID=1649241 RepID=A0A5C6GE30_METRR|nr:hypothetical protein ED733_005793 [Metarhizium rileyi]
MSSAGTLASKRSGSSSSSSSESGLSTDSPSATSYIHTMDAVVHRPSVASVEVLRCMRCARSVEATSTDPVSSTGM